MLYKIFLSIIVISLPAFAHAQVESHVSATSDSGGNKAGPGGKVITGDSSSSVEVTTTSSASGHSTFEIKTNSNGNVEEKKIETNGTSNVMVEVTPQKTVAKVVEVTAPHTTKQTIVTPGISLDTPLSPVNDSAADIEPPPAPVSAPVPPSTPALAQSSTTTGFGAKIVISIQSFFASLFGWFN